MIIHYLYAFFALKYKSMGKTELHQLFPVLNRVEAHF